jgi:biotin operon repressor
MVNHTTEDAEDMQHPASIAELKQSVNSWIAEMRQSGASTPDLQISSKSGQVLVIEVKLPTPGKAGIELHQDSFALWSGRHRLALHLCNFKIKTALNKSRVLLELTPRLVFRPLEAIAESIRDTKHPAFFTRALKAVTELDRELPERVLDEATSASSDYLVLLHALASPAAIEEAVEIDPLAVARLHGVDRQRNLLHMGGGAYTAEQAGEVLGISRQAVDKRRREVKLIGIMRGRRGYAYPAWQFEKGKTLQYLEDVLGILRKNDPWMQVAFFLNNNTRLRGRTPLEALRKGQIEEVRAAAASYGEHEAA